MPRPPVAVSLGPMIRIRDPLLQSGPVNDPGSGAWMEGGMREPLKAGGDRVGGFG